MGRKKHILVLVGVLACLLFGGICSGEVKAMKCGDAGLDKINDSIFLACQKRGQNIPIGTLWISSAGAANDVTSVIDVNNNQSSGNVTVYLHGAVFYTNVDAFAKDIMFIKSDTAILRTWGNNTDYAPLQVIPGRQFRRKANIDPFSTDISSYVTALNLNLDTLINEEASNYVDSSDGKRTYTVNLQAFRCFEGISQPDDRCWSSTSVLKIRMSIPISYVGKSQVSDAVGSSETGFNNSNTEAELFFKDNCQDGNGCSFVFRHYLKRYAGSEAIRYSIKREMNGTSSVIKTGSSGGGLEKVYEGTVTGLRPGEMVCQTLTFKPRGNYDSRSVDVKACALAGGTLKSSLDTKVKKTTDVNYMSEIWVKPHDKYGFKVTYNPAVQSVYNLIPSKFALETSQTLLPSGVNTELTLGKMFDNSRTGKMGTWKNGLLLSSAICGNNLSNCVKRYNSGDSGKKEEPSNPESAQNQKEVKQSDVGSSIKGEAKTIKWDDNNSINDKLTTTPTKATVGKFDSSKNNGVVIFESLLGGSLVLDVSGGISNATSGTNVQVYNRNDTNAQKWVLKRDSGYGNGNYYIIRNYGNQNLVLGFNSRDFRNGSNVQVQTYNAGRDCAQFWDVRANTYRNSQGNAVPDGTYTIISACGKAKGGDGREVEMALDVSGGSAVSGTNLQIYQVNGTNAQKWNLVRSQGSTIKVGIEPISSSAYVKVPYNFNNNRVAINNESNYFIEGGDIYYSVTVGERYNGTLNAQYATLVRGAQHGIEWCKADEAMIGERQGDIESVCGDNVLNTSQSSTSDMFNPERNDSSDNKRSAKLTAGLGDNQLDNLRTGAVICVRAWLFPVSSGSNDKKLDTNWSGSYNTNSNVAYSSWQCLPIVGKDNYLQVWGGNVYSSDSINGKVDEKTLGGSKRYFGSFGELGVISGDIIKDFASGATFGYAEANTNTITIPRYDMGGNEDGDVFGGGSSNSVGYLSYQRVGSGAGVENNKNNIVKNFLDVLGNKGSTELGAGCIISFENSVSSCKKVDGENVYIVDNGGNEIKLKNIEIGDDSVLVIRTRGVVTITEDITTIYDGGNYPTLSQTPKVIIYARNINIKANVGRIDGLLIADETINTCIDSQNGVCNKQLIINGAVIAELFSANRIYGAGVGAQSIVPAEIINFNPTFYKLNSDGGASSVEKMRTVYTTELAPRY